MTTLELGMVDMDLPLSVEPARAPARAPISIFKPSGKVGTKPSTTTMFIKRPVAPAKPVTSNAAALRGNSDWGDADWGNADWGNTELGASQHVGVNPWLVVYSILGTVSVGLSVYHGYKRNDSLGWALGWGVAASFFPVITPVVAFAQGFAEPEKK
jgi:hypothetical protein